MAGLLRNTWLTFGLRFLAVACVWLVPWSSAHADDARVDFLAAKLKDSDYRVRTNAALALGATDSDAAVAPLCSAFGDSSDVVRQASAVALKRLDRQAAVPCLEAQRPLETNDKVRAQLDVTLAALAAKTPSAPADPGGVPRENAGAKYYVQVADITNRTTRSAAEIDGVVRVAIQQKLDSLGVFQIAPAKESIAGAKAAMAKRKLKKGFYLSVSVDPIAYASGVSASVKVAVFSYPNKDLRGEVPARMSASGGPGNKAMEDKLLEMAAARAIELFSQNADQFL